MGWRNLAKAKEFRRIGRPGAALRGARCAVRKANRSTSGVLSSFDQKYDGLAVLLGIFDNVSGVVDEMGNVDRRHRIGAANLKPVPWLDRAQGFARLQRRQRALQTSQIKLGRRHTRQDGPARPVRQSPLALRATGGGRS
jgi:hypothetical protein